MVNYNNGKIYKIVADNGEEGDVYIGSTTKIYLSDRMVHHRSGYKQWQEGKLNAHIRSYDIFDKYGIENCNIILLELISCNSRDELHARERYYIDSMKCINKMIPLRTSQEWRDENKQNKKEYDKEYREIIINKIKKNRIEYMKLNKEDLYERRANPYECDCGSVCRVNDKARHSNTQKHQNFLKQIEAYFLYFLLHDYQAY